MSGRHRRSARHARAPRNCDAGRRVLAVGAVGLVLPFAAAQAASPAASPDSSGVHMPVEAAPRVMIAWEAADAAHRHWLHIAHVAHLAHEAHLAAIAEAKAAAIRAAAWAAAHPAPVHHSSPPHAAAVVPAPRTGLSGHLTYGELEQLWVAAGGPVWAEAHAALIAAGSKTSIASFTRSKN